MIAIRIVFIIVVFNIFMSFVAGSGIFESPTYFEPYAEELEKNLPERINETSILENQRIGSDIISLLFSTFSFNWLDTYTGHLQMREDFSGVLFGLNTIGLLLISIATVEIILVKRSIMSE